MGNFFTRLIVSALFMAGLSSASWGADDRALDSTPITGLADLAQSLRQFARSTGANEVQPAKDKAASREKASLGTASNGLAGYYYPMHDGDWKAFKGAANGQTITETADFSLDSSSGHFFETDTVQSTPTTAELGCDNGTILLYSLYEQGVNISFDPPITFLTDSILSNGGKVVSHTTATLSGSESATVQATYTITVSVAGKVSVPAATYYDCRKLSYSMNVYAYGRTASSSSAEILAPGVGVVSEIGSGNASTARINLTDGVVNGAAVQNLIFESVPPKLAITAPAKNARLTNSLCVMRGTASDNVGVKTVFCQANDGAWIAASGTNSWNCQLALDPGTNVLRACSADACGNFSATNTVQVFFALMEPVAVKTNGAGTVSLLDGKWLEIGKGYTVKASPKAGYLFGNWTDGLGVVLTTNAACSFTMASNTLVCANFIPDPFLRAKGQYTGLFYPSTSVGASNSGFFKATLTGQGAFSAQISLGGQTNSCTGSFDRSLNATATILRAGQAGLRVQIQITNDWMVGTVSGSGWTSDLLAYRSASPIGGVGTYTLLVEGDGQSQNSPPGDGAASVTLDSSGTVRLVGALADGTDISQSRSASQDGVWPFYSSLYNSGGIVIGWVKFVTNQTVSTTCVWIKPKASGSNFYPDGFARKCVVPISHYVPPSGPKWTHCTVEVAMGNLAQPLTSQVVWTNGRVIVTGGSISNLTLTINASKGQFTGSMTHPATGKKTSFSGVLTPEYGSGWFLGTNQAGAVRITPAL